MGKTRHESRSRGYKHEVYLRGVPSAYMEAEVRPPLSEKLFPVSQVGKKTASREVGNYFFPPNFIFYKLECTGGKDNKFFFFFEIRKKKLQSALFGTPCRWTGNNFFFEGGLKVCFIRRCTIGILTLDFQKQRAGRPMCEVFSFVRFQIL